jgi:hypothetical protein
MTPTTFAVVALIGCLCSLVGCGGTSSPRTSSASCAGPRLTVTPSAARVGDTAEVSGEWFAADCYDSGQSGSPPPLTAMSVTLSQDGRTWTVASSVAADGESYAFRVPIRIPTGLRIGPATVAVPDHGATAEVSIVSR